MQTIIATDKRDLGRQAAERGAEFLRRAIERDGRANIILATGASQFEVLEFLAQQDVPWYRVTAFNLDDYIGMPITHPASFRQYLWERFVRKLRWPLAATHFVNGEADDPADECRRLGQIIAQHPIDVAFIGIGENGHLAFNDPPADFETSEAYMLVKPDEACRRQQFGEGWFKTFDDVPTRAITMSIPQIVKSKAIICSVPDQRKAVAVKSALKGPVTPQVPASILQKHEQAYVYLDPNSASQLTTSN